MRGSSKNYMRQDALSARISERANRARSRSKTAAGLPVRRLYANGLWNSNTGKWHGHFSTLHKRHYVIAITFMENAEIVFASTSPLITYTYLIKDITFIFSLFLSVKKCNTWFCIAENIWEYYKNYKKKFYNIINVVRFNKTLFNLNGKKKISLKTDFIRCSYVWLCRKARITHKRSTCLFNEAARRAEIKNTVSSSQGFSTSSFRA